MSKATDPFWVITTQDTDFPMVYANHKIGEGLKELVDDGDVVTSINQWIWNEMVGDFDLILYDDDDDDDPNYVA